MIAIPSPSDPIVRSSANIRKPAKLHRRSLLSYGPIGVLVIDDATGQYCKTVWLAIALGLANVLIGAVNMAAMMYTAVSGDLHVFICTVGYHFFSAEAILSLNYANGWSTPMRSKHRRCVHVFLQICGIICAVVGTTIITTSKGVTHSAHSVTGFITIVLAGFSVICGILTLLRKKASQVVHMSLGMLTLTMASVCLCQGCITSAFSKWATNSVVTAIITFTIVYTVFIAGTVFIKCVSRL